MEAAMADRLALMRAFREVADAGSFSAGARALGLSRAAVSMQVARLEGELGVRLLERTTRRVSLTDEGRRYRERAGRLLDELDALDAETAVRARRVGGRLVVEAPEFVGTRLLAPRLGRFLDAHPALSVRLVLNERLEEVAGADADVLVRFGPPADGRLRVRRLGAVRIVCAASPAYVARHGLPTRPGQLDAHHTIDYLDSASGRPFDWDFEARGPSGPRVLTVPARGRLVCNNTDAALEVALGGYGIVHDLDFVLAPLVAEGRLVPVLAGWRSPPYELVALWRAARPTPPRVVAFVEFLARAMREATTR
jgi:LysR family transcriptional regulator for bpeEF and oprC